MRDGSKVTMGQFVPRVKPATIDIPVVMLVGTSMSAGKTTTGRIVVRELKKHGLRVVAAKLTGAGRYREPGVRSGLHLNGRIGLMGYAHLCMRAYPHPHPLNKTCNQ